MGRSVVNADPLRRACSVALAGHRVRAKADFQSLDYGVTALLRLAEMSPSCAYCGAVLVGTAISFDHMTPTCRTADYSLKNLTVACPPCNSAKGIMNAEEYVQLLRLLRGFHPRVYGDVLGRLRAGGQRYAKARSPG